MVVEAIHTNKRDESSVSQNKQGLWFDDSTDFVKLWRFFRWSLQAIASTSIFSWRWSSKWSALSVYQNLQNESNLVDKAIFSQSLSKFPQKCPELALWTLDSLNPSQLSIYRNEIRSAPMRISISALLFGNASFIRLVRIPSASAECAIEPYPRWYPLHRFRFG